MSYKTPINDGRGSIHQKHLYDLLSTIYPMYKIIYEQEIKSIKMRFDLFIKELGIAVEYDGVQHHKYVEHFHGNMNGLIDASRRDRIKNNFCEENGIKLVRLSGDWVSKTVQDLKDEIERVKYPDSIYNKNCIY